MERFNNEKSTIKIECILSVMQDYRKSSYNGLNGLAMLAIDNKRSKKSLEIWVSQNY